MSDGAPRQGLAARLLRSAEGRVTALRPQIADTFFAGAAQEAPLIEPIAEIAATPPASPPQAPVLPVAAPPPRSRPEPEPFRLMPDERPPVASANPRADTARPASAPEADFDTGIPAGQPLSTASPSVVASPPLPRVERVPYFEEHRADSLSTAVMQLLGPAAAETYPRAPTSEPRPASDPSAIPGFALPVAPVTAATMDDAAAAARTEPAPVQIHIGELVIAPEPPPPVREAAPPAAWEPPLSLADYRASRSRDRG